MIFHIDIEMSFLRKPQMLFFVSLYTKYIYMFIIIIILCLPPTTQLLFTYKSTLHTYIHTHQQQQHLLPSKCACSPT